MLTIQDVEVFDKKNLNYKKTKAKKSQILLCDTHRRITDYIHMIKYRRNGKYDDIPHFIITKMGDVYQILDTKDYSTTFGDIKLDRKVIKVAIENLGWLNKNTMNGMLTNWIGDPYRNDPHIRNWRGHFFWDKYPNEQLDIVYQLCNELCEKHNIEKQIVPSQGYFNQASKFNGVLCKSNYSDIYTDINPSFNFKIFFKDDKKNAK
ncbi:MAG: N-acetylmuramoyl-L-alanine amidase [Candidatus Woesearchaeota archaeon]|jgi:N-acetyl-anhydromuramyl-L-alanine amidase AmpD